MSAITRGSQRFDTSILPFFYCGIGILKKEIGQL